MNLENVPKITIEKFFRGIFGLPPKVYDLDSLVIHCRLSLGESK